MEPDSRLDCIEAFRRLPIAMEIETKNGLNGIVHAEAPYGLTWSTLMNHLSRGDSRLTEQVLWGRSRAYGDEDGVEGVSRVFVGHTPMQGPKYFGNVCYIDTGAVFGWREQDPRGGRLTLVDMACPPELVAAPTKEQVGFIDVRLAPMTRKCDLAMGM